MTAMAIREAFDERRPAARARLGDGIARGAVYDVRIVAVDHLVREPVARRTVGRGGVDRGDARNRRVLHVQVVLADEDDRQLPHPREIDRLVERADFGTAAAATAATTLRVSAKPR